MQRNRPFQGYKSSCGQKHEDTIEKTTERGKEKPGQDDVKYSEHEERTVNASGEVDHEIESKEIQRNLHVSEEGKGADIMALHGFETAPSDVKKNVIEQNTQNDEA
jgi:hypothetical protein